MTFMRRLVLIFCFTLTICSVACEPYEEVQKKETSVEQSIEKFHEQMSAEQYHEIYAQADDALHQRISEDEFVKQLAEARHRTGRISGKAYVFIDQSISSELRRHFSNKQIIIDTQAASCDAGRAVERFQWSIEGVNTKLVSYELRQILERGKVYGIGPGAQIKLGD